MRNELLMRVAKKALFIVETDQPHTQRSLKLRMQM